eukprot:Sspe_Gene.385::Locus_137_Transcript_1_1_Confidence_1.000_Length_1942::g.385::m.385
MKYSKSSFDSQSPAFWWKLQSSYPTHHPPPDCPISVICPLRQLNCESCRFFSGAQSSLRGRLDMCSHRCMFASKAAPQPSHSEGTHIPTAPFFPNRGARWATTRSGKAANSALQSSRLRSLLKSPSITRTMCSTAPVTLSPKLPRRAVTLSIPPKRDCRASPAAHFCPAEQSLAAEQGVQRVLQASPLHHSPRLGMGEPGQDARATLREAPRVSERSREKAQPWSPMYASRVQLAGRVTSDPKKVDLRYLCKSRVYCAMSSRHGRSSSCEGLPGRRFSTTRTGSKRSWNCSLVRDGQWHCTRSSRRFHAVFATSTHLLRSAFTPIGRSPKISTSPPQVSDTNGTSAAWTATAKSNTPNSLMCNEQKTMKYRDC